MIARFSINAVPALAVLDRATSVASNDVPKDYWAAMCDVAQPAEKAKKGETIVSLAYDRTGAARKAARNRDGAA